MGTTEINTTKFGSTDVFSPGAQFDKTNYDMPNVSGSSTTYGYINDFVMVKNILYGVRIGQIDMKTTSNASTVVLCFYKITKNTCTLLQSWTVDTGLGTYSASGGMAGKSGTSAKLYASGDYIYIFGANSRVTVNGYNNDSYFTEIKFHYVRYNIKSNSFTTLSTNTYSNTSAKYGPGLCIDRYNGYLTVYLNFGYQTPQKYLYSKTSSNISLGTRYTHGDNNGKYCYKIIFNSDITSISSKENGIPSLTVDRFINIGTTKELPSNGTSGSYHVTVTNVNVSLLNNNLSSITNFNIDNGQLAFLEVPNNSLEINSPLFIANINEYTRDQQYKIINERNYQFTYYTKSSRTSSGDIAGCITSIDSSLKIYTNGTKNSTLSSYAQMAFDDNSVSNVFYNDGKYIFLSTTKKEAVLIKNGSVIKRFNLSIGTYDRFTLIADSGNNVFKVTTNSGYVSISKLEEITS